MSSTSASFDSLLATYGEPGHTYLSPQRVAEALGMQVESVAKRAQVSTQIARRRPQDERLQYYLHVVVKVLAAAEDVAQGDRNRAIFWFMNEPLGDFGWRTPDKLVMSSKAQVVIDYIESISGGASG
jgi:uncharacterized protein (DUF2384 family)